MINTSTLSNISNMLCDEQLCPVGDSPPGSVLGNMMECETHRSQVSVVSLCQVFVDKQRLSVANPYKALVAFRGMSPNDMLHIKK